MMAGRLPVHTLEGSMDKSQRDLSVLLGKLHAEIVAADPKGTSGLGGLSGRELSELDEGEALNRAKVWRRNVHVLWDIDVTDGAIRGEGGTKNGVKIVRIAWEIAKNDGLTGLCVGERLLEHGAGGSSRTGESDAGAGRRSRQRSSSSCCDLVYQGRPSSPWGRGNGPTCGGLGLLKLGGVGPGHGAVADAPHNGVGVAEGGNGVEQGVKPVGALSKAKCWSYLDHGSHEISGVILVGYYDV
jgi:hypothetical protein